MKTKSGYETNGDYIKFKSGFSDQWKVETEEEIQYFKTEEKADDCISKIIEVAEIKLKQYQRTCSDCLKGFNYVDCKQKTNCPHCNSNRHFGALREINLKERKIIRNFYCGGCFGRRYDLTNAEVIDESNYTVTIRTENGEIISADFDDTEDKEQHLKSWLVY